MSISRQYLVRFISHPSELAELRRGLRTLLGAAPSELCCDVLLGIDEAVANALAHADSPKTIAVHAAIDGGRVTVTISDSGKGFDVAALVNSWPPTRDAESGRGIYLLSTMMDVVTIDVNGGTIVHMSRELHGDGHRTCPPATALSPTRARFAHRANPSQPLPRRAPR